MLLGNRGEACRGGEERRQGQAWKANLENSFLTPVISFPHVLKWDVLAGMFLKIKQNTNVTFIF